MGDRYPLCVREKDGSRKPVMIFNTLQERAGFKEMYPLPEGLVYEDAEPQPVEGQGEPGDCIGPL